MIGDLLIARPLLIGATIIGTGLFVIAAPFAAAGGNLGATGKALVVDPGKAAFVRCQDCNGDGYGTQQQGLDQTVLVMIRYLSISCSLLST
ncbi:hypothetical protein ALP29_200622 [Pseudomonas syringae pv. avii]|uniref:Uncharacterized protein n=1 Tax=Pseudomonas syringae pv. avii TaxID=663959 RepID=A0A3M5UBX2_PSESX|nr:hypothetical protein ALP29_200622 [Pseudomonas syringae pv. avii]